MSARGPISYTTQFVRVGSNRLRVRRGGDGPPLLLVNGLGASIEMWDPLVSCLGDREVVAFDLPGSGRSSRSRVPMRAHGLADLVSALLTRLGHRSADVVGYSFGGVVAQELAYRHAEHVERLVLCATTPGWPSVPPDPIVGWLMLTPARYYDRRLARFIVPRIAGGRTRREPAVLHRGVEERLIHPPSLLGYLGQLYSVWGWTSQPWLSRLRQPTLVIHGDEDPLVPAVNARWLARRIPSARLEIIGGAGHLFLFDEPREAAARIRRFFDDERPATNGRGRATAPCKRAQEV